MNTTQGSSFIPNTPIRGEKVGRSKKTRKVYVLTYISFVLFFGALVATAAVFFLSMQEEKNLSMQKQQLETERARFAESELERVRELDVRLKTAYTILDNTVSVANLMTALESTLLRPSLVSAFTLTKNGALESAQAATSKDAFTVSLDVAMPDFNAVLFQREVLAGNSILQGAEVHEVSYGTTAEGADTVATGGDDTVRIKITKVFTAADIPPGVFPGGNESLEAFDDIENGAAADAAETQTDQEVLLLEETEVLPVSDTSGEESAGVDSFNGQ